MHQKRTPESIVKASIARELIGKVRVNEEEKPREAKSENGMKE